MAFESGKRTTVAYPVAPTDVTIKLASVPTVTSGRIYIKNDAQEEWIDFDGVSGSNITGCTRGLSKTATPATAGTGLTWVAGSVVKLVAMHDQLADKTSANTFEGTQTFSSTINTKGITFTGTDNYGLRLKSLTTTQRDALSPNAGDKIYNSTTGTEQTYYGGTWNDAGTSTTPNASTTVAGKVEKATSGEVTAGTSTGGTGAELFVGPAELKVVTDAILSPIYFGDGADGDVTISSGTTTLTRDMYYNNLTITSPGVLNPAGYRVFVKGTIAGTGTINRNGNNGGNGSNGVAGTAATTLGQGSLNAEVASVAGRAGNNSSGQNGIAGTAATNSLSNISSVAGGAGGAGGSGNSNPGGSAGASAASTRSNTYNKVFPLQLVHPATAGALTQATGISSSGGGASGSGDNAGYHNGGSGGGSGGNGGLIWIFANTWNFTGTCTATGGTGGNGSNAYIVVGGGGNAGGGGGGGGGNGGILLRCYKTLTADCTKTLTGGTGGTAGTGISGGASGTAGQNGNAGTTITITV